MTKLKRYIVKHIDRSIFYVILSYNVKEVKRMLKIKYPLSYLDYYILKV